MQAVARFAALGVLLAAATPALTATAQTALPMKRAPERTGTAITRADLMTRVYLYADDSMMGRSAGSEYNQKATAYIADEMRRLGLVPAGDSGTYFQNVPLLKRELDPTSTVTIEGGAALRLWEDVVPRDPGRATRPFDGAQTVYAGVWGDSAMLSPEQAAGKFVILAIRTGPNLPPAAQMNRGAIIRRYQSAGGIAVIGLEALPPQAIAFFRSPTFSLRDPAQAPDTTSFPVYVYINSALARSLLGAAIDSLRPGAAGKVIRGSIAFGESPAPARNVVAVLRGSDPALRGQYVAIGAHNDHVGFDRAPVDHDSLRAYNDAMRKLEMASPTHQVTPDQAAAIRVNVDSLRRAKPMRRDSIYNGADDDASGTTSVIEIAEAFAGARVKPKRSIVFVWHTAEELGLFGARYFTDNPTVPRDSIVAQLNMDMVGRGRADDEPNGGPGYVQLIGTRRLSTELGDMIESINKARRQPFTFDYQYDASGHPEQYYCRSDHYMYARYGIPVAFFSTGNHRDYHQVTDEPQYIDYEKLTNVTQFVYDVAAAVANLDHRVVVDKPKPDPRGNCVQ